MQCPHINKLRGLNQQFLSKDSQWEWDISSFPKTQNSSFFLKPFSFYTQYFPIYIIYISYKYIFLYIYIYVFLKSQRPSGCESTTTAIAGHREGRPEIFLPYPVLPSLSFLLELASLERLAKLPVGRNGVVAGDGTAVAGGDLERETLSVQVIVALPILSPISGHGLPSCFRTFDRH